MLDRLKEELESAKKRKNELDLLHMKIVEESNRIRQEGMEIEKEQFKVEGEIALLNRLINNA